MPRSYSLAGCAYSSATRPWESMLTRTYRVSTRQSSVPMITVAFPLSALSIVLRWKSQIVGLIMPFSQVALLSVIRLDY